MALHDILGKGLVIIRSVEMNSFDEKDMSDFYTIREDFVRIAAEFLKHEISAYCGHVASL